jgi:hypothetical protein
MIRPIETMSISTVSMMKGIAATRRPDAADASGATAGMSVADDFKQTSQR